jgi:hypothetical protein
MTWGQWGLALVAVVVLGVLVLTPPSFQVFATGDVVTCRPIGLERRGTVPLSSSSGADDAIDNYLADEELADDEVAARRAEAEAAAIRGCANARQDRQTLIMIALAGLLGALVVMRTRPAARTEES